MQLPLRQILVESKTIEKIKPDKGEYGLEKGTSNGSKGSDKSSYEYEIDEKSIDSCPSEGSYEVGKYKIKNL